jgi:ribonuclease-3
LDRGVGGVSLRELSALEDVLGYHFIDRSILTTALTHRSYANEQGQNRPEDNEKFEFLGDAVLGLVIGELLLKRFPELHEGQLSMARGQIVSEGGLAQIAREWRLGDWLHLGRGEEQTGGREKPSILADAVEAVVAAIYLDAGFSTVSALIGHWFEGRIADSESFGSLDWKTQLQEAAQAVLRQTPEYRVVAETGPDHDKVFEVSVFVGGEEWARATGKSKKAAEQRAAEIALHRLPV